MHQDFVDRFATSQGANLSSCPIRLVDQVERHTCSSFPTFSVRPFIASDVDQIHPQQQQLDEFANLGVDWREMLRCAAQSGPSWSGVWDDQVIGCGGFALRWPGRAGTWCVLAADIPRPAWLGIHRAVQRRLREVQALNVWRVEAETMKGYVEGERWLRLLGFEHEGVARGYGPGGEDFGRYARVTL